MKDSYGNAEPNVSGLFQKIDEQRKIIEQQKFVLSDFTAPDIFPNAFVGYLGKTEDGKAELAKKEIVKAFDINKSMKAGTR